jgi:hypothetical protein
MKKQIFLFLVLSVLTICVSTCQPAFAQSTPEIESQVTEPVTPRRSFRIVFEGTFQGKRSQNYNQQTIIPGDYINTQSGSIFSDNTLLSTNPFSNYNLSPAYNYGLVAGSKNIMFGFDANFLKSTGRRFVVSSRTSFTSSPDSNFSSKETWLKLHTEGKKQSSLVLDFTIKIIR